MCCRDTPRRERRILLTRSEATAIASHTGLRPEKFCDDTGTAEPYTHAMKKVDGRCVFLRDEGCLIYTNRPLICRFFPFYLEKQDEGRFVFGVSEECPGVGRGPRLNRRFFYNLFRQAMISRGESVLPL